MNFILSKIYPYSSVALLLACIGLYFYGYSQGVNDTNNKVNQIVQQQLSKEITTTKKINEMGNDKTAVLNKTIADKSEQINILERKLSEQKAIIDHNNVITTSFVRDVNSTVEVYVPNATAATHGKITAGGVVSASNYQSYIINQFKYCNAEILKCNTLRSWIESTNKLYNE